MHGPMTLRDLTSQRLFVTPDLVSGAALDATPEQANYLRSVLRMVDGAAVLVFNGRDGEWRADLRHDGKRGARLLVAEQTRPQEFGSDLHYLFAPLKRARLDYMVQKAVEMGVRRLVPVLTRHTIAERVNLDRLGANAIEAAEQCGVLWVPEHDAPERLETVLDGWDRDRRLIFCDEAAAIADPVRALAAIDPGTALAVLIGPEGGFSVGERERLRAHPGVVGLSLGPRIMRADTAAVAALALVNAVLGDWRRQGGEPLT